VYDICCYRFRWPVRCSYKCFRIPLPLLPPMKFDSPCTIQRSREIARSDILRQKSFFSLDSAPHCTGPFCGPFWSFEVGVVWWRLLTVKVVTMNFVTNRSICNHKSWQKNDFFVFHPDLCFRRRIQILGSVLFNRLI